jgi:ribosomal protein L7Ae-like RNA K-turn-binding protein
MIANMMNNRFIQLLGLATKAGKTVSGEFQVEQAIKSGSACLVIIAADASDNTKKHFHDMCTYRDIRIEYACDKLILGRCTGKQERASIGILDKGFADRLISILREG